MVIITTELLFPKSPLHNGLQFFFLLRTSQRHCRAASLLRLIQISQRIFPECRYSQTAIFLQHAFQMHMLWHFIPGYNGSRSVITENRRRRIPKIRFRIIPALLQHFFRIMAASIATENAGQPASSFCIRIDLFLVILNTGHRHSAREHGHVAFLLRQSHLRTHTFQIHHSMSQCLRGHLQTKIIPWLQQYIFRLHQSLPDSPVSRLPEVAALCMLLMGPACHQSDPHIRDIRTGEYTFMLPLLQMR